MATIIHKIAKRVNEMLTAYKNAQREFNSPVIKQLVPSLATAVAVAALEAMNILKGVRRTMASQGHCISARSTANENRLLDAVTLLTYKNERLQQHSHRESIHVFSTK